STGQLASLGRSGVAAACGACTSAVVSAVVRAPAHRAARGRVTGGLFAGRLRCGCATKAPSGFSGDQDHDRASAHLVQYVVYLPGFRQKETFIKFGVLARVLHEVVTCVADGRFEGTPEVLSTSLTAVPARNRAAVGPVRVAPLEPIGIEGGRVLRRSTVYPYRAPPHGAGRGQSAAGSGQ